MFIYTLHFTVKTSMASILDDGNLIRKWFFSVHRDSIKRIKFLIYFIFWVEWDILDRFHYLFLRQLFQFSFS